jgi:hypothetical protein
MKKQPGSPPEEYWDEIRQREGEIYERCATFTPVFYPGEEAVDLWQSGVDSEFDTTAYSRKSTLFRGKPLAATLLLYNQGDTMGDPDAVTDQEIMPTSLVRLFEVSLRPGKEKLIAYAALLQLAWHGLSADNAPAQRNYRLLYMYTGFAVPTPTEYDTVREQFRRGTNEALRIRHPNEADYSD